MEEMEKKIADVEKHLEEMEKIVEYLVRQIQ